jgi:hypothetical protein
MDMGHLVLGEEEKQGGAAVSCFAVVSNNLLEL